MISDSVKVPMYHPNERVVVVSPGNLDTAEVCRVIYAREDGKYLLRLEKNGSYVLCDESSMYRTEQATIGVLNKACIPIVFYGNAQFALPTLRMLVEEGYNVRAVVTAPDKPSGKGGKLMRTAVKEYAVEQGLTVMQPSDMTSNRFLRRLGELNPALGVVVEFRKIPTEVIELHEHGIINLHSSLLPAYRGASPITSALQDGEVMTGVSTILINEGIDRGPVINNLAIGVDTDDNAGYIHLKLRAMGAVLVNDAIQRVLNGYRGVDQSELVCDYIHPSDTKKLRRADCLINWRDTAENVYNFVRAHAPIPAAWTKVYPLNKEVEHTLKILSVSKTGIPSDTYPPGATRWVKRQLMIACKDEFLAVDLMQLSGKRAVTSLEFYNGYKYVAPGFCHIQTDN